MTYCMCTDLIYFPLHLNFTIHLSNLLICSASPKDTDKDAGYVQLIPN